MSPTITERLTEGNIFKIKKEPEYTVAILGKQSQEAGP